MGLGLMSEHPPIPDVTRGVGWDELLSARADSAELAQAYARTLEVIAKSLWHEWTRGMAVVPLPEPTRGERIWVVDDDDEICAWADSDGPVVSIELGDCMAWIPAQVLRTRALAELAAADRAEQLAAEAKAVQP